MTRYYSLTECEHGEVNVHATEPGILREDGSLDRDKVCPGGERRELTGVQAVWRCEEHKADFLEKTPDKYSMCMSMLHEDAWDALPEPEHCIPGRYLVIPLDGARRLAVNPSP